MGCTIVAGECDDSSDSSLSRLVVGVCIHWFLGTGGIAGSLFTLMYDNVLVICGVHLPMQHRVRVRYNLQHPLPLLVMSRLCALHRMTVLRLDMVTLL